MSNHGWKVEGDQGLGPTPNTGTGGTLVPRGRPKAGLGVGCGRGLLPPAMRVRDRAYHHRKIFENSYAKSCILVTTCCEISCFLKTTAKKVREPIHCWSSQAKGWGPVSPGLYGCCAYDCQFSFYDTRRYYVEGLLNLFYRTSNLGGRCIPWFFTRTSPSVSPDFSGGGAS